MTSGRGSAAVEFALVLPLVLVTLLAAVEVAVVARSQLEVVQAAREGAREAATNPDPAKAAAVVRAALGPAMAGAARVTVRRPERVGGRAEVAVSVQHQVAAPLFGGFVVELRARAAMRVER